MARLSRALLVTSLVAATWLRTLRAQQASPLAGYGFPSLETTEVYLNVFLDRLLGTLFGRLSQAPPFVLSHSRGMAAFLPLCSL